jgi:hypothetical protein
MAKEIAVESFNCIGVIEIIFYIRISQICNGTKMMAIAPLHLIYTYPNGGQAYTHLVWAIVLSTAKAMREPEYRVEQ